MLIKVNELQEDDEIDEALELLEGGIKEIKLQDKSNIIFRIV